MKRSNYFELWLRIRNASNPKKEIARLRRRYWLSIVAVAAIAGIASMAYPEAGALVIGMSAGSVVGAISICERRIRDLQKNWSVLEEVVDWDRLEKRTRENA
jgi:hypothetical protein